MLSNLLTFSHTQQPITTIFYTHGKMGVNEKHFHLPKKDETDKLVER